MRKYEGQVCNVEVDPEFHLFPKKIERADLKDELVLKNNRKDKDIDLVASMSRTAGGAFVDELS